jgi:hypothetical protein
MSSSPRSGSRSWIASSSASALGRRSGALAPAKHQPTFLQHQVGVVRVFYLAASEHLLSTVELLVAVWDGTGNPPTDMTGTGDAVRRFGTSMGALDTVSGACMPVVSGRMAAVTLTPNVPLRPAWRRVDLAVCAGAACVGLAEVGPDDA